MELGIGGRIDAPGTVLAVEVRRLLDGCAPVVVAHSERSYQFAAAFATSDGVALDDEVSLGQARGNPWSGCTLPTFARFRDADPNRPAPHTFRRPRITGIGDSGERRTLENQHCVVPNLDGESDGTNNQPQHRLPRTVHWRRMMLQQGDHPPPSRG
jgi:hypothetical protein